MSSDVDGTVVVGKNNAGVAVANDSTGAGIITLGGGSTSVVDMEYGVALFRVGSGDASTEKIGIDIIGAPDVTLLSRGVAGAGGVHILGTATGAVATIYDYNLGVGV